MSTRRFSNSSFAPLTTTTISLPNPNPNAMDFCTIPELIAFLKSTHLSSDFKMAEAILICREVHLKKQHSDAIEELKDLCFGEERKFAAECSRLESRCDELRIELEASRKELSEISEAHTASAREPRKKVEKDQALLRSLSAELEASRTLSARLEKEIKEEEENYPTTFRNLKAACERNLADGTSELRSQCGSLIGELRACAGRCGYLEAVNERHRMTMAAAEAGRWEEKCAELEARVLEAEQRVAASGSSKEMELAIVPVSAGMFAIRGSDGEDADGL